MSSKNKSRRPQDFKKKAERKVATAASWGGKKAATFELDLPSGHTVLMKRVDLPTLLASGAFPDALMTIVSEKIGTATGQEDSPKEIDPAVVQGMIDDPKKLGELFTAVNKILPIVVAEPAVAYHKRLADPDGTEFEVIPDEDRDEDVVYTDQIDLEDQMFIFQYTVGGTREVETFREELTSVVADVPAS